MITVKVNIYEGDSNKTSFFTLNSSKLDDKTVKKLIFEKLNIDIKEYTILKDELNISNDIKYWAAIEKK